MAVEVVEVEVVRVDVNGQIRNGQIQNGRNGQSRSFSQLLFTATWHSRIYNLAEGVQYGTFPRADGKRH